MPGQATRGKARYFHVIEIELPYPPSINHYYRRVGPRTLISREGRRYRGEVASALAHLGLEPMDGPLEVRIDVFPPDRRRRDLDNVQKALIDAMEHAGVYHDDSQIKRLVAEMHEPVREGSVVVAVQRRCRGSDRGPRAILG